MSDDLQSLIRQSGDTDIRALLSAKENAKRRMIEYPSRANVDAFDKAAALLKAATGTEGQDFQSVRRFDRLSDVVKFLKEEGYKIGKSKLYQDAKAGFLTGSEVEGYSLDSVLAYAHTQMLDKTSDKGAKIDKLTEIRLQKEVEKLTAQVHKLQFELQRDQGKFLPKDEVRTEFALRFAAIEASFKHLARTRCQEWVEMVSGDPAATERLVKTIFDQVDELLDELAVIDELGLIVQKRTETRQYAEQPA